MSWEISWEIRQGDAQIAALRDAAQAVFGLTIVQIADLANAAPNDDSGNRARDIAFNIRQILNKLSPGLTDTAAAAASYTADIRAQARREAMEAAAQVADHAFMDCDADVQAIGERIGKQIRGMTACQ